MSSRTPAGTKIPVSVPEADTEILVPAESSQFISLLISCYSPVKHCTCVINYIALQQVRILTGPGMEPFL